MAKTEKQPQGAASSNWLALQKKLHPSKAGDAQKGSHTHTHKKRKIHETTPSETASASASASSSYPRGPRPSQPRASTSTAAAAAAALPDEVKNGESLQALRRMIAGDVAHTAAQKQPGKYLAMDCEMVGVGLDGKESALARVSVVNFHGAVQLDVFVRQKERVVDYRTEWSGIRPADMVHAKPFEEVQKQVAELLKDRILVGHAIHNDMKALLLSHPRPLVRDTQTLARKHKLTNSPRPALRHLVQQELGLTIQGGEHSSVVDARATMAVYRIHRKTWEKGMPQPAGVAAGPSAKRKRATSDAGEDEVDEEEDEEGGDAQARVKPAKKTQRAPDSARGGRKGVSSGLSTIIKRRETKTAAGWWKDLGGGSKASLKR